MCVPNSALAAITEMLTFLYIYILILNLFFYIIFQDLLNIRFYNLF
jgi:hypothetical protein